MVKSQAYWAAVKQHQLGNTNVDPDSQTLVVEHVIDLQETQQHSYFFHMQDYKHVKERQMIREIFLNDSQAPDTILFSVSMDLTQMSL